MPEGLSGKKFSSPEEEIEYLRRRIAERERELFAGTSEVGRLDVEAVGRQELREYGLFTPRAILEKGHRIEGQALATHAAEVGVSADPAEEIVSFAFEKGVRNALSVLEKMDNAYVVDEVHRRLVERIRGGAEPSGLKEGVEPWRLLHMTLFEVTLPELRGADNREYQLAELVGMMEQLFAGLRAIGADDSHNHFTLEVAVADGSDDIVFYAAIPNQFTTLFEKQTLSLFPRAVLTIQARDYNIFVNGGVSIIAEAGLKKHPIYPLRTTDGFLSDPLTVLLNAFSKIEREGGGAAAQFVIRYPKKEYRKTYEGIIKEIQKGMKPGEAISRSTTAGAIFGTLTDLFTDKKKEPASAPAESYHDVIEVFQRKIKSYLVETNLRLAVSARTPARAKEILTELEATFNQFELVEGNTVVFSRRSGRALRTAQKAFSFREFSAPSALPLSLTELATLIHFPANGISSTPQFKQSHAATAAAPTDVPLSGTLLGVNRHRGVARQIFITDDDRLRHFYIIGQTGTGKTTLMKNMIVQDIRRGEGVCFIDPHGTDVEDVLAAVPDERVDDVIYFDPSIMTRVVGLNMLEYDISRPEQKTFVVNELFSIFKKLYGANPESLGPMFEQYFRNATLLVMEDPKSGNTLMDISRVMADASYRRMKLEKAKNPVVVQFWREIAAKAGGEASLENIVPYISSKFDVFTANDYMRPIIGQPTSTLDFRRLMDERKILLVNLAKGRLGEINANLIGMILVGKFLMAALSRVDDPSCSFPPFYLHMDEFQNVSTDSISTILSEARKYKLGLTIAHQFIAQLEEGIKDAVFGNVGSLAAFRVGQEDAQFLERQFAPVFNASDLMNIPNRTAYLRLLANGVPAKPFSIGTLAPVASDTARATFLKERSAARYGRPREEVEAEIAARYRKDPPSAPLGAAAKT
jgi:hypothetical protein